MKSITQLQLESLLMATSRAQFVSLTCVTDPTILKRNNPHANARKVSIVNGVICWQYSSSVDRQRAREAKPPEQPAKFRAVARKWGTRIKKTPLVSHVSATEGTTRLYLEVKIQHRVDHYFDPDTKQRIDAEALAPFIRSRSGESSRQQVASEIVLRDFRLDHIAELTLAGVRYTVAPAATELQTYYPKARATRPLSGRARTATSKRQPAKGAT